MAEEAATLRPCPFDSGEAYIQSSDHKFFVGCMTCYAAVGEAYDICAMPEHMFHNREDAIAAWNRRAEDGWVAVTPETKLENAERVLTCEGNAVEEGYFYDGKWFLVRTDGYNDAIEIFPQFYQPFPAPPAVEEGTR